MLIQCTKALLDKLNISEEDKVKNSQAYAKLFRWHGHIVNINRRKTMVFMNDETRFPVVIYRPVKKDYENINELINEAIGTALYMEGVSAKIISHYLEDAGEVMFSGTSGRSMQAKMNHLIDQIHFIYKCLDENTRIQRYVSHIAGTYLIKGDGGDYYKPSEMIVERLADYYGYENIIDTTLYQLKITLNIKGHDIWRRVRVPSFYSFRNLHTIIQTVFDWQDYHLHEFEAIKDGKAEKWIIMDDDPETMFYAINSNMGAEILQDRFVALQDILPKYNKVMYRYDFGDCWEHTVKLEQITKSYETEAVLLGRAGIRPPEDVGGIHGYEEYLNIISDISHPDHEDIKIWADSQKERKLSIEDINKQLKRVRGFFANCR